MTERDTTLAGSSMPIRVAIYTTGGKATGVDARTGHLREILETTGRSMLGRVRWQPLDAAVDGPAGDLAIAIDDVLIAIADDDAFLPVHASWHAVRLEVGPWVVEGDMPTLPGYDPGRALTRPSGEFVLLGDVRVGRLGGGEPQPAARQALINRYAVERVEADIMLGFFFPGAALGAAEEPETAVQGPLVARTS